MEFGPGEHKYALRYWLTDPEADDAVDTQVRLHLVAAFQRAGIALALPEYVFHQIKENQARQDNLRARETERRMAALESVELFATLTAEERRQLAAHLVPAPFAAGDVMTRQGAVAHWLYLLVAGEADVWLDGQGGERRKVATLAPGQVFGEMGMMTGEPRRATVTAKTDAECYRLDKAGFREILVARPALAEAISQVLAARASGLQQASDEARAAAARMHPDTLLERIRTFFGIQAARSTAASPSGSATTRLRPDFLAR
jgi:CRP-like cAMP-binding protein